MPIPIPTPTPMSWDEGNSEGGPVPKPDTRPHSPFPECACAPNAMLRVLFPRRLGASLHPVHPAHPVCCHQSSGWNATLRPCRFRAFSTPSLICRRDIPNHIAPPPWRRLDTVFVSPLTLRTQHQWRNIRWNPKGGSFPSRENPAGSIYQRPSIGIPMHRPSGWKHLDLDGSVRSGAYTSTREESIRCYIQAPIIPTPTIFPQPENFGERFQVVAIPSPNNQKLSPISHLPT